MNIFRFFDEELQQIIKDLQTAGDLAAGLDTSRVVFELPPMLRMAIWRAMRRWFWPSLPV